MRRIMSWLSCTALVAGLPAAAMANETNTDELSSFSLIQDTEYTSDAPADLNWDAEGIVRQRAADVQEFGTVEFKVFLDYATYSGRLGRTSNIFEADWNGNNRGDDQDDDIISRFEMQWGFMENMELVLKLPINYGDGKTAGNYPLHVGLQWKISEGQDWMPSFALYNELRVGTYKNHGADWEIRPIMTFNIVPDEFRLHVNPFFQIIGNENYSNNRHYNAGTIIGFDWRMTEDMFLNVDYVLETGLINGMSMQHLAEVGVDWAFAENQMLSLGTRAQLDGDAQGPNWGITLAYMYTFDNLGGFTYTN